MQSLVTRAQAAGCEALVLTTDAAVFGNREWDRRSYRPGTTDPTLANKLEMLAHPGWLWDVARPGIPPFGNLLDVLPPARRTLRGGATWARSEVDPALDWDFLHWLRGIWRGPLLLKGVLAVDDALRARDAGVDGLVLSNHGGRQLDGAVSPMTVLPQMAARVGADLTLLVDSGFRRGTDVAKALALGARGVLVGRAVAYGLAAGGEAGVTRALTILHDELRRTLALLGRPSVAQLGPDCLHSGRITL
jgi:(S)-mandelate dehydrogenase